MRATDASQATRGREELGFTSSLGLIFVQVYRSRSKHSSFMIGGMSCPLKIQKPLCKNSKAPSCRQHNMLQCTNATMQIHRHLHTSQRKQEFALCSSFSLLG